MKIKKLNVNYVYEPGLKVMTEQTLEEKFKSEVKECNWAMLVDHDQQGVVFVISDSLTLVEAGLALAEDNVDKVKAWQDDESIRKPTTREVAIWSVQDKEMIADFLIVQPFVIIKLKKGQSSNQKLNQKLK